MKNLLAIVIIILLAIGYGSIFVVKEGTRSIVVRFGKVVGQNRDPKKGAVLINPEESINTAPFLSFKECYFLLPDCEFK